MIPPSTEPVARADGSFALLLGAHPEPHWLLGVDGRIRAINTAARRILGTVGERIGGSFDSWATEEDRPVLRQHLAEAVAGAAQRLRVVLDFDAHEPAPYEVTFVPLPDDGGAVTAVVCCIADASEAVAESARRAELERRLEDTLTAFGDGLAFLDADARLSYVNSEAAAMVGSPPERLVGMSLWDLFPESRGSRFETAFHDAIASGERTHARERSDRLGMWLDCTLHPTREGLVLSARDATDDERFRRAAAAAQLRATQQAALLDATRDAVIVRSLDGIVQYCNAAAARMYGWDPDDVTGRSIHELIEDRTGQTDAAMRATVHAGYWADELHELTRDGRRIIVDSRWQLLRKDDGTPTGVLSLGTDITRWRQVEQERHRARRLESLGTLAGGIAHDLNNVLTPILMAVQLLEDGERDPARRELLATMETSARRGADMVAQVLAFGRGIDGRREPVRFGPLLAELGATVRDLLPASISLEIDAVEDDAMTIGDSTQLLQVLTNLVTNARDAMPAGGIITLTLRVHASDADPDGEGRLDPPRPSVVIDVVDTGMGMSDEVVEKIFEPFFTTKPHGHGTGLGLATSLSIVRSHGGSMRIASTLGSGTSARVVLPLADQGEHPPLTPASDDEPAPRGAGELVLVVDDDQGIRSTAVRTLLEHGYRAMSAADGREAIEIIESGEQTVDIVLTDMMMPGMDGAATSAYLEEHHPAIPVVASSGLVSRSGEKDVPGMGVAAFLPKPYSAPALLLVLRSALDSAGRAAGAPSDSPRSALEYAKMEDDRRPEGCSP